MKELQYSKDIKEELNKEWNKGIILRQKLCINKEQTVIEFPYKIKIRQPASKERVDNLKLKIGAITGKSNMIYLASKNLI